jgi:hypothetical protein
MIDMEKGRQAYLAARARIAAHGGLLKRIQQSSPTDADRIIELACWGEYLWLKDGRFRQTKREREADRDQVVAAARALVEALRASQWPIEPEFSAPPCLGEGPGRPVKLSVYLERFANHTEKLAIDFPEHYPPKKSATSRRAFMLRHIKYATRDYLSTALAADLASAVLNADVTTDDIKKA